MTIFCAAIFPWLIIAIVNGTVSPNLTGVNTSVTLVKAKSNTGTFSGSASSSSVAGSPSFGEPVPFPNIASSAGESTKPPASLSSIASGVESLSFPDWSLLCISKAALISATLI